MNLMDFTDFMDYFFSVTANLSIPQMRRKPMRHIRSTCHVSGSLPACSKAPGSTFLSISKGLPLINSVSVSFHGQILFNEPTMNPVNRATVRPW